MSSYYGIARTTIGNLGSSYTRCYQAPYELKFLHLTCGDLTIGEIISFGIVPFKRDNNARRCLNFEEDPC